MSMMFRTAWGDSRNDKRGGKKKKQKRDIFHDCLSMKFSHSFLVSFSLNYAHAATHLCIFLLSYLAFDQLMFLAMRKKRVFFFVSLCVLYFVTQGTFTLSTSRKALSPYPPLCVFHVFTNTIYYIRNKQKVLFLMFLSKLQQGIV